VLFDPPTLEYLCAKFGADRVMLGSDYPFPIGDPAPLKVVRESNMEEIDISLILGETAARLFRIEDCC
jgi:aminocarboxymuconate-semialdehyde decarboxylase